MTKTVTISALRADSTPYAHHDVIVTLVAGSAGGVVGSNVIVSSSKVRLDANGAGSVVLETNEAITSPATSFYRLTVEGSSPTITRSIRLTNALASSVSWTLADIQVGDPTTPDRDVSSDYVTIDGQSLTNYLTGVALLDAANEFTAAQSIDVAVPLTPFAELGTTKPTVLVHLHPAGGQIVDHISMAMDFGGGVEIRASGNLVQVIDSDGDPTDEWILTPGGGRGPGVYLVESSDPGELPSLLDLMVATPMPMTVGTGTDTGHAMTKGQAEAAFAAIAHDHDGDYSPFTTGADAALPTGNWLLVCSPNSISSSFSTPDFGPFTTGADVRMRVAAIEPDPARTGEDVISFLEVLTQLRQAPGEWGDDQDNLELALAIQNGDVGVFGEHCKTSTPAPVQAGEYVAGRVSSLPSYNPDEYDYIDTTFRLRLNEAITARWTYEFDVAGQWRQRCWREVGEQDADVRTDDDGRYWRIILTNTGTDGPGSIADAGMPFVIGTNDGLLAVEWLVARDGIEGTVLGHFHADDLQEDGTVESSVVTGQTWTPTGSPVHVDTTLLGLAAALASGGGGAVDSVNGETGTVVLTAADVGAATSGHNHSGVYDPAGSAATAQAAAIAASQPVDSDLTAIAALTTTSFGRSLLTQADAAATLAAIGASSNAAVPFKAQVGDWVSEPHDGIYAATQTLNRVAYVPWLVPAGFAQTDGIAVEVTTVATSALCRLGIYLPHATTGRPGALVIDGGTVDFSSGGGAAGIRTLTITATNLTPGSLIYVAVVPQGATATARHCNSGEILRSYGTASSTVADVFRSNGGAAYYENSVSGALPANATPIFGSITGQPVVALRRSA